MNREFSSQSLDMEQQEKLILSLVNNVNDPRSAERAVALAVAKLVYNQDPDDLETIAGSFSKTKVFQTPLKRAALVIFGYAEKKDATGKSWKNTYKIERSDRMALVNITAYIDLLDFDAMKKRFNQFIGSVKENGDKLSINRLVADAWGTLLVPENVYNIAYMSTSKSASEQTDSEVFKKAIKKALKGTDMSRAEIETALNEVLAILNFKLQSTK